MVWLWRDTVLYVSKVFADDVSRVRHTRSALEMILSTLLSKLYHTVYSSLVPLATTRTFISRFPSTHCRLRGVCVCFVIEWGISHLSPAALICLGHCTQLHIFAVSHIYVKPCSQLLLLSVWFFASNVTAQLCMYCKVLWPMVWNWKLKL